MTSSSGTKFVVLPTSCVISLATHENIALDKTNPSGNEMAALIAEDVTYQLREILSQAIHHKRMSRRTTLKASDVEKVFKHNDHPPLYGVASKLDFAFVPNTDAYVVPDGTVSVELKHKLEELEEHLPAFERLPLSSLSFSWHDHKTAAAAATVRDQRPTMQMMMNDGEMMNDAANDVHSKYYSMVVELMLGDDRQLFFLAVKDLRTNPRISSVLPYFVTLFTKVGMISHHRRVLCNMLCIMKAILDNPYLSPVRYLRPFVESALYCVVVPVAVSTVSNDHWILRDYGAFIAADLIYRCPSHTSGLLRTVEKTVFDMLHDKDQPLCSHYGSFVLLSLLDIEFMIPLLLPPLADYVDKFLAPRISKLLDTILTNDACRVMSAVLLCVRRLLREDLTSTKFDDKVLLQLLLKFDFWELFGDSMVALLPPPKCDPRDRVIKTRPATTEPTRRIRAAPSAPIRPSSSSTCLSDVFDVRNRRHFHHHHHQPNNNKIVINYGRPRSLKVKRPTTTTSSSSSSSSSMWRDRGNGSRTISSTSSKTSKSSSNKPVDKPVFLPTASLLSWI